VEEEEPPMEEWVTFLTARGDNELTVQTVRYAGYANDGSKPVYIDTHGWSPVCDFTHWMLLPAPPQSKVP
jgi:hypothetical protein